jgi:two-component system, OmpR family, sensor kinase
VGRLATTFNDMLASLESSQTALRRFVFDAAHELRTPITSIRGNAEVLVMAPDLPVEERNEATRDIAEEAARLSRLSGGLLALARGDAGPSFQPQWVEMHEMVRSGCRSWAARPGPEVRLETCEPALVLADPDRLEQLLNILLDNATKYTPVDGLVICTLHVDASSAYLTVRDSGIGIHPDDLPHIFERFYRADHTRRATETGAGLGLAIARQILDEAGAGIAVESEPGRGSTFTVRFALAPAQPAQPEM